MIFWKDHRLLQTRPAESDGTFWKTFYRTKSTLLSAVAGTGQDVRTSPRGLAYVSLNVSLQWGNACNTQCFITRPRAVVPWGARAPWAAPLLPAARNLKQAGLPGAARIFGSPEGQPRARPRGLLQLPAMLRQSQHRAHGLRGARAGPRPPRLRCAPELICQGLEDSRRRKASKTVFKTQIMVSRQPRYIWLR